MKIIKNLKAKPSKFPLSSKKYEKANSEADVKEKKEYPKGYKKLGKLEKKLPKGEILGHISKAGKVSISSKVPKKLRKEVVEHDKEERREILKKKR